MRASSPQPRKMSGSASSLPSQTSYGIRVGPPRAAAADRALRLRAVAAILSRRHGYSCGCGRGWRRYSAVTAAAFGPHRLQGGVPLMADLRGRCSGTVAAAAACIMHTVRSRAALARGGDRRVHIGGKHCIECAGGLQSPSKRAHVRKRSPGCG